MSPTLSSSNESSTGAALINQKQQNANAAEPTDTAQSIVLKRRLSGDAPRVPPLYNNSRPPIHAPLGAIIVAVSTPLLIQHAKYSNRKTKQASKQHMTSDSISATPCRGLRHDQHRPTSEIIIGSERQLRAQHNPRQRT